MLSLFALCGARLFFTESSLFLFVIWAVMVTKFFMKVAGTIVVSVC